MDPYDTQGNSVVENQIEDIFPPGAFDFPTTRLGNFRYGGTSAEYQSANSLPCRQLERRNKFTTVDQAFRFCSLNEAVMENLALPFQK